MPPDPEKIINPEFHRPFFDPANPFPLFNPADPFPATYSIALNFPVPYLPGVSTIWPIGMVFVKYGQDVKVIVVKMSLRGLSLMEINNALDHTVSPESLSRWNHLYQTTRSVIRDPALYEDRGRPLAFTHEEAEFVLEALEAEPTLYIDEIQSHLLAMTGTHHPASTIKAELKLRLMMTKKVARTVNPAQCPLARAAYSAEIGAFPAQYLVFLDECAVSLGTHSRDRAWALRGRRTQRIPKALRAARISVLPAVSLDGLLCSIAQEGTIVRLDVEYFIEEVLIPVMNPFPGRNSILVLDNAPVHHGGRIAEICDTANVLLFYLPTYSPNLNPIEKVFSVLKSQLKRQEVLTGTGKDAEIIKDFLPSIVSPDMMRSLYRGCGY